MATKKILIQIEANAAEANAVLGKVKKSLDGVAGAQVKMTKGTKDNTKQTGLHNAILMETSRLASDVSYGFTAVANNLGQLIDLFKMSANSAGGVTGALRNLIKISSILIIGIQLLISFLPKIIKHFRDKAKAARAVKDALIEGTNAVQGQVAALQVFQDLLNSNNISLAKKENLIKQVAKQFKLENVALDENNHLTEHSNNLIKQKIQLLMLEAQANVLKGQIQEELTKRAKELAEVEEDVNGKLSKATDFVDRHTQGIQDNVSAVAENIEENKSLISTIAEQVPGFGLLKMAYEGVTGLVKSYSNDVNSAEAVQSRQNKAQKESNKIISESEARLKPMVDALREVIVEIAGLEYGLGEFNKTVELTFTSFADFVGNQDKLRKITADFNTKLIDDEYDRQRKQLDNQRDYYLTLVDNMVAGETVKEKARNSILKYYSRERERVGEKEEEDNKKLRNASLKDTAKHLNTAAGLFAEHTAANKALRVASAVIDTYAGANTALASSPPPFNFIQAAAVIAAGLANVKKIFSTKVPNDRSQSAGGGSMSVEAPDFNVVGQSATSQLVGAVQGQFGGALRAYVVSSDISSAQELDRKINTTSVIG